MKAFHREHGRDHWDLREELRHPDRGAHRFFRRTHTQMQARFVELSDVEAQPTVFLHGNPHVANYAKARRGAAMVDFDRSRFGPYGYDLVRFLVSVSLRRADDGDGRLVHGAVSESLRRGYLLGLAGPELGREEMHELKRREPKGWQRDLVRYLEKGKAWSKRLREHAIDPRSDRVQAMWTSYLESRGEEALEGRYALSAAAEAPGSQGKAHTLLLLEPLDDSLDALLLDVKETYDEPDTPHFWSPYAHDGERMVAAGELHAPGWEQRPGWATVDGEAYWVREIPTQNEKMKRRLDRIEQIDLCFAVGSQLGRAHGLSVRDSDRSALVYALDRQLDDLLDVALQLLREVRVAHRAYVDAAALSDDYAPHGDLEAR